MQTFAPQPYSSNNVQLITIDFVEAWTKTMKPFLLFVLFLWAFVCRIQALLLIQAHFFFFFKSQSFCKPSLVYHERIAAMREQPICRKEQQNNERPMLKDFSHDQCIKYKGAIVFHTIFDSLKWEKRIWFEIIAKPLYMAKYCLSPTN